MVKYIKSNTNPIQQAQELRRKLVAVADMLGFKGITNIKEYEIAFQNVIEKAYPGQFWWEVTPCNIYETLLETQDPYETIDCIIADMGY